jgi:hypothetical protein
LSRAAPFSLIVGLSAQDQLQQSEKLLEKVTWPGFIAGYMQHLRDYVPYSSVTLERERIKTNKEKYCRTLGTKNQARSTSEKNHEIIDKFRWDRPI